MAPLATSMIRVTSRFMKSRSWLVISKRPLELAGQPLLQPDDRLDVKMVGRLVEEEHVGVDGEDFRQGDAHLPAAAERFHRAAIGVRADAETGQHRLGAGLEIVAAAMLELLVGIAVAGQQVGHGVIRHRLAHGGLHGAEFHPQRHGAGGGRHHLFQGRAAGHLADILGEVADDRILATADLAGIGMLLAGDQAEDGGLAGAVGADQAAAAAGEDLEAGVLEEDPVAMLPGHVAQVDHAVPPGKVPKC